MKARIQGIGETGFADAVDRPVEPEMPACELFEEKHHLLEALTRRQLELIVPSEPRRILVVGCGTALSAMALRNVLAVKRIPRIFVIDTSESMLSRAKERYRDVPGLYFVHGDADNLSSFFHDCFDGIFYTPSIFPIPNFRESIRQAAALLVPGGVISTCHYAGLFTETGEDAMAKALPERKPDPAAFSRQEMESFFAKIPDFRTNWVDFRFEAHRDVLSDFLSVPRQHALFPKLPYFERLQAIQEICAILEGVAGGVFMGWQFCVGRKERKIDG